MQNMVKNRSAAKRPKNAERPRESSFLRTAKRVAHRNAETLKELAKH
ncbi:hypothetical protein BH24ACT19_BH24ACT19_11040 [soil metagenome]|jgi:hypothetical protein